MCHHMCMALHYQTLKNEKTEPEIFCLRKKNFSQKTTFEFFDPRPVNRKE